MKNRKGDSSILVNNAISIVIAIVCIVLVGYFIWLVYLNSVSQDEKRAKDHLNLLVERINQLKKSDVRENEISIVGPEKWIIKAWGSDAPYEKKPSKCLKSCLCFCFSDKLNIKFEKGDTPTITPTSEEGIIESCEKTGFCKEVEFEEIQILKKYTETEFLGPAGPGGMAVKYKEKEILGNTIIIPKNLLKIKLIKQNDRKIELDIPI